MKNFQVINVRHEQHVVREINPRIKTSANGNYFPDANYLKTGMALCGILKRGETLKQFKSKVEQQEKNRNGKVSL